MKTTHAYVHALSSPTLTDALPPIDERSPLEFPFGCFIADAPGYGGGQGFSWFPEADDLLAYLRKGIATLYETDDDPTLLAASLASVMAGCEQLAELDLARLNDALTGLCEVRWVGSLDDLYVGEHPFARVVQWDFRENIHGDERGFLESEIEDFACHLAHYTQ